MAKNQVDKAVDLLMNNDNYIRDHYTLYINENYPKWFIKKVKENYERLGVKVRVGKGY